MAPMLELARHHYFANCRYRSISRRPLLNLKYKSLGRFVPIPSQTISQFYQDQLEFHLQSIIFDVYRIVNTFSLDISLRLVY